MGKNNNFIVTKVLLILRVCSFQGIVKECSVIVGLVLMHLVLVCVS